MAITWFCKISGSQLGPLSSRQLRAMVAEGRCERHLRGGSTYYLFVELQPRLTERYCEYCETEFPIAEELEKCPNCGGTLETRVTSRSLSAGEHYHMDT